MTTHMTSRERVRAALAHREPDRVPIDIGGSSVSTIIGEAYERLKRTLGVTGETQFMKKKSYSSILDERIALRLRSDTRALMYGSADGWQDIFFDANTFQDEFQVVWQRAEGGHFAPVGSPLRDATIDDLDKFQWPDPLNPGRFRGLRERAQRLHATGYAVVLSLPNGCVHQAQYMRGYEEWLVDTLANPDFADALLERTMQWWNTMVAALLDECGEFVDVVLWGDDVAFQDRPMLKLAPYRHFIKPRHTKMNDTIKAHSQCKIVYHTDGSVIDMVDEFIDTGADALNPVQISAKGMRDTAQLKARYGDRIAFWGGIDTNYILPNGTPDEVRAEVRRRILDLAPGGGYVLTSVHNMQEDVSPENILAMADEAFEFGQIYKQAAMAR